MKNRVVLRPLSVCAALLSSVALASEVKSGSVTCSHVVCDIEQKTPGTVFGN